MKKLKVVFRKIVKKLKKAREQERGSALVIVTLILALLTIYVSASLMNATSDAISSNFEVAKKRAFFSAYSKLEQMTGDFSNLFLTSLTPTYDSMCRVVIANPSNVNGFDLKLPKVTCPPNSNCSPTYSGKYTIGTDLFDLGWEGDPLPASGFCLVDVCNPNASPVCGYPLRPTNSITIPRGDYAGLLGFARRFRMIATARADNGSGADVQVTRDFNNYLIPAFQFGIFSDTDFELYTPPPWTFGGWVHTNGNFYATGDLSGGVVRNVFRQYKFNAAGNMVTDAAKITIVKHLIIGKEKSGINGDANNTNDFIRVYTGPNNTDYTDITVGTSTAGANNPSNNSCGNIPTSIDTPGAVCPGTFNPSNLDPTLKVGVRPLRLPIQNILGLNAVEIIKRGLPSDYNPSVSSPLILARYYYKPGIRITLADYQNQLPKTVQAGDNPANGNGQYGGIQLDGPDTWLAENVGTGSTNLIKKGTDPAVWYYMDGKTPNITNDKWPIPRGYQPKIKSPGGSATPRPTGARVNGARIHGWIKVEVVRANGQTVDITEEMLNLGVTVPYQAAGSYYYPRTTAGFPGSLPLDISAGGTPNGPYPDENSIIHLQRFAVPHVTSTADGNGLPALDSTSTSNGFSAPLDDLSSVISFDYYSSMALNTYNNNTIKLYGINDDPESPSTAGLCPGPNCRSKYTTRYVNNNVAIGSSTTPYAEPQPDPGGYYTDALNAPNPLKTPKKTEIDFTGAVGATRPAGEKTTNIYSPVGTGTIYYNGGFALSENVNLPKNKTDKVIDPKDQNFAGETTWRVKNTSGTQLALVPFPVNMYDSREGVPHESDNTTNANKPVPGIAASAVSKPGVMNLIEIDMGNLGRFLRGDFDSLFTQMGSSLKAATALSDFSDIIHENIKVNQDNGWLVYVSDRRGDEPLISTNVNLKTPSGQYLNSPDFAGDPESVIGDGTYNRENVIWSAGGDITTGSAVGLAVKNDSGSTKYGCDGSFAAVKSDNQDAGKSPQDANTDCFIFNEDASGQYSETAPYKEMFDRDQSLQSADTTSPSNLVTYTTNINDSSYTKYRGALVAMTQVGTVKKQSWSYKPPVAYRESASDTTVEIFRRAVRLVNADNLFPSGTVKNPNIGANPTNIPLGVTVGSENPVYIFGNYNAPAGTGIDTDTYPGINVTPPSLSTAGVPTSLENYNGQTFSANCTSCHVPAAIISDAVSFLSGPCVGSGSGVFNTWSNGVHGWLDSRSFVSPYQAIGVRTARNTVYRFGLIAGYTSGWYPTFWGDPSGNNHQGSESRFSSGGLNNFPRFLEDWGQNGNSQQFAIYAGSLIRAYRSQQGNGAFKRNSSASVSSSDVDYVYAPPRRDWVFDLDFSRPSTLPPGTPFLQLVDFKGFQESSVQERE